MTLERLQASVARRILRVPWDTPKQVLFRELDWPSLRWRRTIASLVLLHSFLYSDSCQSSPISNLLPPFSSNVTHRSLRKPFNLVLKKSTTSRHLHSFINDTSILWNNLPSHIQSLKNKKAFKTALEQYWQHLRYITSPDLEFS